MERLALRLRSAVAVVACLAALLCTCLVAIPAEAATTYAETVGYSSNPGGVINTWTNYANAGGTAGPAINPYTTVQSACAVTGFRVADGDTWWYQIASAPWNGVYYASADAFYNNGQTGGSLAGTPPVDPAVPLCGGVSSGITEQQGSHGVTTFSNPQNASGAGPGIAANTTVNVSCKLYAPAIASVNPDGYWYRIASSPWNDQYYAPANTFMNGDPTGGPYTHNTDFTVPDCERAVPAGGPSVSLAQGPATTKGYRYAVSISGFAANAAVSISCYDSVSTSGFYRFSLTTGATGSAATQAQCLSGDGPDHWVFANNTYVSNHVSWGSGGGGGTSNTTSAVAGNQGAAPPRSQNTTACNTPRPVNCATGTFWHTFPDFSVPGRGVSLNFAHTYSSAAAATGGPLGYGWTNSYNMTLSSDGAGNVTVTEENGVTVAFSLVNGKFEAPARVLAALTANSDGSYTFTRRTSKVQYVFSAFGLLQREIDRNGYVTQLNYNGDLLSSVVDPAGRRFTFMYVGAQISAVADPIGAMIRFRYDAAGNLVTATDVRGGSWNFTYDAHHILQSMTDPRGGVTLNQYDQADRVVRQVDPAGFATSWTYSGDNASPTGGTTTMTNPNGSVTLYKYQNLEMLAVTHGAGTAVAATTSYTYDQQTLGIATETDPNGHTTRHTYDPRGNQLTKVDGLGRTTTTTYNGSDDPLTVTDAAGGVTTRTYDLAGNLLTDTTPTGAVSSRQYGAQPGDVAYSQDPNGTRTVYSYDAQGDLTLRSVAPSATSTIQESFAYDMGGRLLCRTSGNATAAGVRCPAEGAPAVLGTTRTTYDDAGHVVAVVDPKGATTTTQYDASGNRTQVTDALGRVTTYAYDADDRLAQTTLPDGATTTTKYDGAGNVVTTSDGNGHVSHNGFDQLNRRVSTQDPLGRTTTFRYDPPGNLAVKTDAVGRTETYTYDAANELTAVDFSTGLPSFRYSYDAVGRRVALVDGTGTTSYAYDKAGKLTATKDGAGHAVGYAYDANGNQTAITYPNGKTVKKAYDKANSLTGLTDWAGRRTTFSYDANKNVTQIVAGSSSSTTDAFSYDATDRMTARSSRTAGGVVLQSANYARDANGLVASVNGTGTATQSYAYSSASQLSSDGQGTYTYDRAGNGTRLGSSTPLVYNAADELVSQGSGTGLIHYSNNELGGRATRTDAAGNVTSYYEDGTGRMGSAESSASAADYAYDGDGLRTTKKVRPSGSSTYSVNMSYAWDTTAENPLLLGDGATSFIYGPGGLPIESVTASGVAQFYHHDQLGSTTLLTSGSGAKVTTMSYSSYGKQLTGSTTATPLLFAGQYRDNETGFYYLRARYYDPTSGQFTSVDPALERSKSRYGYVQGNPVNEVDPSGLCWGPECWVEQHWRGTAQAVVAVGAVTAVAVGCAGATVVTIGGAAIPCVVVLGGSVGYFAGLANYGLSGGNHTAGGYLFNGVLGIATGVFGYYGPAVDFAGNLISNLLTSDPATVGESGWTASRSSSSAPRC